MLQLEELTAGLDKALFRSDEEPGRKRFQVSGANDPAEQRAGQMADNVTGGGRIFRSAAGPDMAGGEVLLSTADLSGAGEALPVELQGSMERSFGTSFSGVRVHTDMGAERASRQLSARAFTQGQDMYFSRGAYNPGSQEGRHLIAHELAHVAAGDKGIHRTAYELPDFVRNQNQQQITPEQEDILRERVGSNLTQIRGEVENEERQTTGVTDKELDQISNNELTGCENRLESLKGNLENYEQQLRSCVNNLLDPGNDLVQFIETSAEDVKQEIQKVENLLHEVTQAQNAQNLGEGNEEVKAMANSPYFSKFIELADKVRAASGIGNIGNLSEMNESISSKTSAATKAQNMSQAKKQEALGVQIPGKTSTRAGAKKWLDAATATMNLGANISSGTKGIYTGRKNRASKAREEAMAGYLTEEENQETKNQHKEKIPSATADIGENAGKELQLEQARKGFSAAGSFSALVKNSIDVDDFRIERNKQRKQNDAAKNSMKKIGVKLEAVNHPENSYITNVCARLKVTNGEFNPKNGEPLSRLIQLALDNAPSQNQNAPPVLTGEQKKLLVTLKALEASRSSSENAASAADKEHIFGSIGATGNAVSVVGSILDSVNSIFWKDSKLGLASSIISMIGSSISSITGIIKSFMGKDGPSQNQKDAQMRKFNACRAAVEQMAGLPELKNRVIQDAKNEKLRPDDLSGLEMYAAAFHTIQSANVNMADILYAIDQGKFDSNGMERGLQIMYQNLTFSN